MKHARQDYDRIQDPAGLIPADEPVFLIRGQDEFARRMLSYYCYLCEQEGLMDVARKVRDHLVLVGEWPKKKLPDLPRSPQETPSE